MKAEKFKGSNVVFAKDQPEYKQLPAHKSDDGIVTCSFRLSFSERLKVLFKGRFVLKVWTFNQPLQPILPSVELDIE